ncbi:hypothetical protein SAMN02745206_00271 [Desulfacinum infernum DSM 9756]|uniref:Permease n=1 Tax=Desulfacinum infernum DSM 9756 TaxID=1121391 RepID=A0A1M4TG34_9BACT|nr:SO_0444 family Cu/Zn efflux transporter [Desulfacinum infernum]SHE43257.1 hypothetical protein SAMN02745206_00271 [Desulfacinum infernum DSM 9756]
MSQAVFPILLKIVGNSWAILAESAPFILFGLWAAGLVKVFLPEERILRHLGGHSTAAVVKASLLGIPLPLCSCGVLPVAMDLRKRGAGKGPSTAFLVSVPETGVDSIALSYVLLGPVLAVLRPLAAFVTATVTGMLVNLLPQSDPAEAPSRPPLPDAPQTDPHAAHQGSQPSLGRRVVQGMLYGFSDLLQDLGGWLFLGILLSGVIAALLPQDVTRFLTAHEGWSLLLMLAVGIPLYICASASTPVAAALILKGLSPGAALVFLLAGPATNTATLTVLGRFWGKAVTAVYLASVASCTLFMGWITNLVFETFNIPVAASELAAVHHSRGLWEPLSAALLLALYLLPLGARKIRARWQASGPTRAACSCSSLPGT